MIVCDGSRRAKPAAVCLQATVAVQQRDGLSPAQCAPSRRSCPEGGPRSAHGVLFLDMPAKTIAQSLAKPI